jgi:hypothetical protein
MLTPQKQTLSCGYQCKWFLAGSTPRGTWEGSRDVGQMRRQRQLNMQCQVQLTRGAPAWSCQACSKRTGLSSSCTQQSLVISLWSPCSQCTHSSPRTTLPKKSHRESTPELWWRLYRNGSKDSSWVAKVSKEACWVVNYNETSGRAGMRLSGTVFA